MVFDLHWFRKHQTTLLAFANTKIGRYLLCINGKKSAVGDNRILKIEPNAIYWQKNDKYVAEFRTQHKYAQRLYYGFQPFWEFAHFWDTIFANNWKPNWNVGFDTLIQFPGSIGTDNPVDGYTQRGVVDESLATIRSGAGQSANITDTSGGFPEMTTSSTNPNFRQLTRTMYCFDTTSLAGSSVLSATLSLYGDTSANQLGGAPEIDIVGTTPAATTTLAASDYGNIASIPFASIAHTAWNASGYNDFALDMNGIINIARGAISKFGARVNWDTDNSFTGTWATLAQVRFNHFMSNETGTSKDPKLTVTFTLDNSYSFFM